MSTESVIFEIEKIDDFLIGVFSLNAPQGNKMTISLLKKISKVILEEVLSRRIDGLIIQGKGRHFSSGANTEELIDCINQVQSFSQDGCDDCEMNYPDWFITCKSAFQAIRNLNIPVISKIKGFCIGSGMELASSAHVRLCAENSYLGYVESQFGLIPGAGGTIFLLDELSVSQALALVLEGKMYKANEALQVKLVDRVIEKHRLDEYAKSLILYLMQFGHQYAKEKRDEYLIDFEKERNANEAR